MRTTYVGMDIHKNFIQAAALDEQGNIIMEQKFKTNDKEIQRFVKSLKAQKIQAAIEATCTWYHVYEILRALDVETTLVNMRRTKTIAESKIKTDKLDAKTIAHCLRTGFIATAYIPPKHIMEQRNILRHRMSLRKELVRYKNKIHAILLRNGIQHRGYSDLFGVGGMNFLQHITIPDSEQYSLTSYLNIVEALLKEKTQIEKKIETLCKNNHQAMLLTSIPGISYYSAMIILMEMGEVQRFSNPKKLCSYAGLVPRTIQSGSHVYHGRILKECNQNIKWILGQCTHIHIRHCPSSLITKLYCRVESKRGANKATVAASRKLLTCIWHMLMKDETFKYDNDN
ncbi:IS110 family transposase [Candidatus Bathyarchaeota archaeon]|nr:IS110 family transposase [Candidatus Bathyarchaeota archaeon]